MAGCITLKFSVMKNGMKELDMKSPIYVPGPVEPQFGPGRYIYFEGFSVDEEGRQHYMDATVAYRQTCLRAIEYLRRFGEFTSALRVFWQRRLDLGTLADFSMQVTTTIRSIYCWAVRRCRVMLRVSWIFRMRARRWVCRLISSTLISAPKPRRRSAIWGLVLLRSSSRCEM